MARVEIPSPVDHAGRPRVVITGVGALTGDGVGVDAVWDSFVRTTDEPVAGTLEGFEPRQWLTSKEVNRSARFVHLAVAAAAEAFEMAGRPVLEARRTGVVMATVYGALETIEAQRLAYEVDGPEAVDSYFGAVACENAAAAALSHRFGARGPSKAVIAACAGGGFAIADAAELIRSGRCDTVFAGGSQAMMTPTMQASYTNLRVLATDRWCRPFDLRRRGFVFGEGAGVLVLEHLERVLERGGVPLAEFVGWGNTNDAANLVRPSGQGAEEAILDALGDAGLAASDIAAINAHGTGTIMNDLQESRTINTIFGDPSPPVTSIKRVSGHLAGAAGALEAVSVVLCIAHGLIPHVGVEFTADEEIEVDLVIGQPRRWTPGPTLSNSFGLAGHNCALVISPYHP